MSISSSKTEIVFWQQSVSELLKQLHTTPAGLSTSDAADRLKQVGPNMLRPPHKRALVLQFLSRFKNPLVIILLAAARSLPLPAM